MGQHGQLKQLLEAYGDVLQSTPGKTPFAEHSIDTGESHPVPLSPYREPHAYRGQVEQELEAMLQAGVVEPSNSEWVLVKKKDGGLSRTELLVKGGSVPHAK